MSNKSERELELNKLESVQAQDSHCYLGTKYGRVDIQHSLQLFPQVRIRKAAGVVPSCTFTMRGKKTQAKQYVKYK